MSYPWPGAEWLEADGLGGFASGPAVGPRTRRYHALLLAALTPPTGRVVLVNGLDAWLETPAGSFPLSTQKYAPGIVSPDASSYVESFTADPWPTWSFRLPDGTQVEHELFVPYRQTAVALRWRRRDGSGPVRLTVRPFLSGRDYHSLHRENPNFQFDPDTKGPQLTWQLYPGIPPLTALTNGAYIHQPWWYHHFLYDEELARGLDHTEDLASPGVFTWDLDQGDAVCLWAVPSLGFDRSVLFEPFADTYPRLREKELTRRQSFATPLDRAADAFLVRRDAGLTLVAGYPWFTDWGRDTFIAIRGLCVASGRLAEAQAILGTWAGCVSQGMLPNRFPDRGEAAEFNAVDASLWFVVAVHDFLETARAHKFPVASDDMQMLRQAALDIVDGYSRGTRFGIRLEPDGLLAAGERGTNLTWMDACFHDQPITPRVGKPVEIQALWLNALEIIARWTERWDGALERGRRSFHERFWNESAGFLHDVVDLNHQPGAVDPTFRPNQILAVGGLPHSLLERDQARRVVDAVEARLYTPLGLRSLAPESPGYAPRCIGNVRDRDTAYHQGTAWPWLLGPFVEAWVRSRGDTAEARRQARQRFLPPLWHHLEEAGIGHLSEIADGDPPHTPRGCPFQAWSLGELLRLDRVVLIDPPLDGKG